MGSEFERLNQGDPNMNLGVIVITNLGESILVSCSLRESMKRDHDLWQDYMNGTGPFEDERVGQEKGRQRTVLIPLYFEPQNHY